MILAKFFVDESAESIEAVWYCSQPCFLKDLIAIEEIVDDLDYPHNKQSDIYCGHCAGLVTRSAGDIIEQWNNGYPVWSNVNV